MNLFDQTIALRMNELKESPLYLKERKAMEKNCEKIISTNKKNRGFLSLLFGRA